MPIIRFIGHLMPLGFYLSQPFFGPVLSKDVEDGTEEKYEIRIMNSEVEVICTVNTLGEDDHHSRLRNRAFDLARAAVEVWAFRVGMGIGVSLDRMIDEKGEPQILMATSPGLEGFYRPSEEDDAAIFSMLVENQSLMMAMNDLISSISFPWYAQVNCARAVDALRALLSPNIKNDAITWAKIRESLNVDEDYLRSLTSMSKAPRHGVREWRQSEEVEKIIQRAWELMNRYLTLQIRGPLSQKDYPQLQLEPPSPTPQSSQSTPL